MTKQNAICIRQKLKEGTLKNLLVFLALLCSVLLFHNAVTVLNHRNQIYSQNYPAFVSQSEAAKC